MPTKILKSYKDIGTPYVPQRLVKDEFGQWAGGTFYADSLLSWLPTTDAAGVIIVNSSRVRTDAIAEQLILFDLVPHDIQELLIINSCSNANWKNEPDYKNLDALLGINKSFYRNSEDHLFKENAKEIAHFMACISIYKDKYKNNKKKIENIAEAFDYYRMPTQYEIELAEQMLKYGITSSDYRDDYNAFNRALFAVMQTNKDGDNWKKELNQKISKVLRQPAVLIYDDTGINAGIIATEDIYYENKAYSSAQYVGELTSRQELAAAKMMLNCAVANCVVEYELNVKRQAETPSPHYRYDVNMALEAVKVLAFDKVSVSFDEAVPAFRVHDPSLVAHRLDDIKSNDEARALVEKADRLSSIAELWRRLSQSRETIILENESIREYIKRNDIDLLVDTLLAGVPLDDLVGASKEKENEN